MYKGGWTGRFPLRERRKDSLLVGLKVTNQVVAHRVNFTESQFKQPTAVVESSTIIKKKKKKKLVSSANNRICEPLSTTISLIYA